jgi:entericidin B
MKVRFMDPSSERTARHGAVLALFLGLFMILALAGCNTMRGAGEDVSSAGDAVSDTAEDVQDEM